MILGFDDEMTEINKTCCFFGHRDTPDNIKTTLIKSIENLINVYGVNKFYVGNQGRFDSLSLVALKELSVKYPEISYSVVLAYLPNEQNRIAEKNTLYPYGIESVPKRFCISWRNDWMINHSQYVICYITHITGGAAKFVNKAEKRDKTIINLS